MDHSGAAELDGNVVCFRIGTDGVAVV